MKKRIVFGCIFATFILLSLSWMTPVQASGTNILDEVSALSKKIIQDENLDAIKSDPDLIKLASMINVENRDANFKNEVESLINKILEKQEFIDFMHNHNGDVENFLQLISEKYENNLPNAPRDVYYKIYSEDERINIKKDTNPDLDVDGIVVSSSDNSVTFNGVSDGGFLQSLLDFVYWLSCVLLLSSVVLMNIGNWIMIQGDPIHDDNPELFWLGSGIIGIACLFALAGGVSYLLYVMLEGFLSIIDEESDNNVRNPSKKLKFSNIFRNILKSKNRVVLSDSDCEFYELTVHAFYDINGNCHQDPGEENAEADIEVRPAMFPLIFRYTGTTTLPSGNVTIRFHKIVVDSILLWDCFAEANYDGKYWKGYPGFWSITPRIDDYYEMPLWETEKDEKSSRNNFPLLTNLFEKLLN